MNRPGATPLTPAPYSPEVRIVSAGSGPYVSAPRRRAATRRSSSSSERIYVLVVAVLAVASTAMATFDLYLLLSLMAGG
jgi:hypothetical protein